MRPADRRFAYKETDRLLLQACRPHVSAPRLAHKLWDAAAQWGMLLDEASMLAYKAAVEACDPDNSSLLETVRSLQHRAGLARRCVQAAGSDARVTGSWKHANRTAA